MFDNFEDSFCIISASLGVFTAPLFIAATVLVYKHQHELYYEKRGSTLVLVQIVFLGIMTVICCPLLLIGQCDFHHNYLSRLQSNVLSNITICITNITIYAIINEIVARIIIYICRIYHTHNGAQQIAMYGDSLSNDKNDDRVDGRAGNLQTTATQLEKQKSLRKVSTARESTATNVSRGHDPDTDINFTDKLQSKAIATPHEQTQVLWTCCILTGQNLGVFQISKHVSWIATVAWVIQSVTSTVFTTEVITNDEIKDQNIRLCLLFLTFFMYAIIIILVSKIDTGATKKEKDNNKNKNKSKENRINVLSFQDNWYIRQEFICYGKILILLAIATILRLIIRILFPNWEKINGAILSILFVIGTVVGTYITSFWVIKINEENRMIPSNTKNVKSVERETKSGCSKCECDMIRTDNININDTNDKSDNCKRKCHNRNNEMLVIDVDCSMGRVTSILNPSTDEIVSIDGDGISPLKVTKFGQFFDVEFDKINGYITVRKQFELFLKQCSRELCVENILFWIHWVQLLQFLIDKNIIDTNNNDISFAMKDVTCGHFIQDTILIKQLKNEHEQAGGSITNIHMQALVSFYCQLFKQFFETGTAPFELNISWENRNKLTQWYEKLSDETIILTKEIFVNQLWKLLTLTAFDIVEMIQASFYRFLIQQGNNCL